ncbi:hypothetical protein GF325_08305 [Candidatus Bathyarchaeota archaeon]|nr:hypothetical protein [Candidatus Bathyarchaeota archaeon]
MMVQAQVKCPHELFQSPIRWNTRGGLSMTGEFSGIAVPVLSMFDESFKINKDAQELLVKHVINNGANVLFLNGSTGEGQFLQEHHPHERVTLIQATRAAISSMNDSTPVIFGLYGESRDEVVTQYEFILDAIDDAGKTAKVDGFVIAPPLTRKMNMDELESYFRSIISQVREPVFLYNNPSKFGRNNIPVSMLDDLLSHFDHLKGFKDSSPSIEYKMEAIKVILNKDCVNFYTGKEGDFFNCLTGTTVEQAKRIGCIPSIGNVLNLPSKIWNSSLKGKEAFARDLQEQLNGIRNKIYHEASKPGKAQRGGKIAFSILYRSRVPRYHPVVSPEYEMKLEKTTIDGIRTNLELALQEGFMQLVP